MSATTCQCYRSKTALKERCPNPAKIAVQYQGQTYMVCNVHRTCDLALLEGHSEKNAPKTNFKEVLLPLKLAGTNTANKSAIKADQNSTRNALPYGNGAGHVKNAAPLIPGLSREELIDLAARVASGDQAAVKEAQMIALQYVKHKEEINALYASWAAAGRQAGDVSVQLAAELLGRFCRCVKKARGPVSPYAICQKSIYHTRGFKGITLERKNAPNSPKMQEYNLHSARCDEDLAKAEIAIEGTAKNKR